MIFQVGFSSGNEIGIGPAKWRWAEKGAFQFPRGDVGISKRGIFAIVISNTKLYDILFVSYMQVFIYNHVKCQLAETVRQVKCDVHGTRNMSSYLKITWIPQEDHQFRLGKMRRSFWAWSQTHFTCQVKDFDKESIKYFVFIKRCPPLFNAKGQNYFCRCNKRSQLS